MSAQLDLFEGIENKEFPAYHLANPQIYELYKVYTKKAIQRGFNHISSDFIFHIIRWETNVSASNDPLNFKVNNNFTPFYSRLFMNEHPHLAGFFRTRKSKYDNIVK